MVNQKQLKTMFSRIKYKDKVGYIAVILRSNMYPLYICIAPAENTLYITSLSFILSKLSIKRYSFDPNFFFF